VNLTESESPRSVRSELVHRLFEIGILLKGIDGALELVSGLALVFLPTAAITGVIHFLVSGELQEDPTDFFANLLLHQTRNIIQSQSLASVFLIVHGGVKLALVAGLALNRLWSYPAAIVIFAGLSAYQGYQLAFRPSWLMAALTSLDVAVVVLIAWEYRHVNAVRRGL
jgi:uncharacterized membrane protein